MQPFIFLLFLIIPITAHCETVKQYYESGKIALTLTMNGPDIICNKYNQDGILTKTITSTDNGINSIQTDYDNTRQIIKRIPYKSVNKMHQIDYRCFDMKVSGLTYSINNKPKDTPQEDCIYSLWQMRIIQKLKNGYLIRYADITEHPEDYDFAFLYSKDDYKENEVFPRDVYVYSAGSYTYKALNGFKRSIFAFKLYDKDPDSLPSLSYPKVDISSDYDEK